jgi:hypothetical protein
VSPFLASLGLRGLHGIASVIRGLHGLASLFRSFVPSLFRSFVPSVFLASLGLRSRSSLGDAEHDGALQRYYGDAELGRDVCSVNRSVSGVGMIDHDAREHSADGAEPRRRDAVHSVLFFFFVLRLGVFVLFSAFGPVKKKNERKKRKEKTKRKKRKKKKRKEKKRKEKNENQEEKKKKEEKRCEAQKKNKKKKGAK